MDERTIGAALENRKVARRDFLKFCALVAGALSLPPISVPRIARALEQAQKPRIVWLAFQDCAGCTESALRAANPTIGSIVLDILAIEYQETIMAAAGSAAIAMHEETVAGGGHIVLVEGAIPTAENGIYCTIGGKTAVEILKETVKGAAAVIAVGNCASFGNLPAASPNPTGARGVRDLISGVPLINLAGCPMNADNFTATIVHYLTFNALPSTDSLGRPLFAYGSRIHDHCERRAHFDSGQFVETWGDEGHRLGWCMYKTGCKGPQTYHNCPSQRWNGGVSWPIGSGHGCIGCSQPAFWDTLSPFYRRLPDVPGFGVEATADKIGLTLTGITAAGIAAHAVASVVRKSASRTSSAAPEPDTDETRPPTPPEGE